MEKSIQAVESAFDRECRQIRTDYVHQLARLETSAIEQRLWTLGIWAHRQQRMAGDWEEHWIALLAEEYKLPEALTLLHENTSKRVTQLREQVMEQIIGFEKASAERLLAMEKRHVQRNNIDLAVATRAVSERIQKINSATHLKKRLLAYDPVKAREHLKKGGKLGDKEQIPNAPPDARFPFRGDNAAFQAFLRTVKVESAGFHAGPSAGIALGENVRYPGTRGLAVVALVDREAVLQDSYDTYAEATESERLIQDLGRLPYGALVVMAARDDVTRRFSGAAHSALFRLGAAKGVKSCLIEVLIS